MKNRSKIQQEIEKCTQTDETPFLGAPFFLKTKFLVDFGVPEGIQKLTEMDANNLRVGKVGASSSILEPLWVV